MGVRDLPDPYSHMSEAPAMVIQRLVNDLPDTEQKVIILRNTINPKTRCYYTFIEIGERLNLTREKVRKIEVQGVVSLKKSLRKDPTYKNASYECLHEFTAYATALIPCLPKELQEMTRRNYELDYKRTRDHIENYPEVFNDHIPPYLTIKFWDRTISSALTKHLQENITQFGPGRSYYLQRMLTGPMLYDLYNHPQKFTDHMPTSVVRDLRAYLKSSCQVLPDLFNEENRATINCKSSTLPKDFSLPRRRM